MPAFGPISIKDMFDEMHDIATQLVSKWARMGSEQPIELTADTTRLTFDTISLCATGMRFNSFYREDLHPFLHTVADFLTESGERPMRTSIEKLLNPALEKKFKRDIEILRQFGKECVDRRKANPMDKKDLLNAMLFSKDPKTGQNLTDESIVDNMITFLVAGKSWPLKLLNIVPTDFPSRLRRFPKLLLIKRRS